MSERINPWLEEALRRLEQRRKTPRGFLVIVQVDPARQEEVKAALRRMRGVRVVDQIPGFIRVDVSEPALLEEIARISGVVRVSYDVPVWPMAKDVDEWFKALAVARDPLLRLLTPADREALGIRVRPTAMLPKPLEAAITPKLPLPLPVFKRPDVELCLVTQTRGIIGAPRDYALSSRTPVAVIDTGATPHPALRKVFEEVSLVLEPPGDFMGHGQWCTTCAFGDACPTRYGWFVPVASAARLLHVKVFMAFGPTSAWHVMKAMEIAVRWGARVVSMSLGGPLQGRVDEDPECVLVRQLTERYGAIFVIAAGNEGPGEWTIASPGASPYALTVGAYSWLYRDVAVYSSRGPSGEWYRTHQSDWEEDYAKYGELLVKPDCLAPGGGPAKEGQKPVDQIVSGVTGWYDGFLDFTIDGFEGMRGTSMATPHAAGLVALAIDRGRLRSLKELKRRLRATAGGKSPESGWGLITWSRITG